MTWTYLNYALNLMGSPEDLAPAKGSSIALQRSLTLISKRGPTVFYCKHFEGFDSFWN